MYALDTVPDCTTAVFNVDAPVTLRAPAVTFDSTMLRAVMLTEYNVPCTWRSSRILREPMVAWPVTRSPPMVAVVTLMSSIVILLK